MLEKSNGPAQVITGAIYLDQDHKGQNLSIAAEILLSSIYVTTGVDFNALLLRKPFFFSARHVAIYYSSNYKRIRVERVQSCQGVDYTLNNQTIH